MIDADAHPSFVAVEIVDAVRDGFPVTGRRDQEVMDAHPLRLALGSPRPAPVLSKGEGAERVRERALWQPRDGPKVAYRLGAHHSADNWLTIGSGRGWIQVEASGRKP